MEFISQIDELKTVLARLKVLYEHWTTLMIIIREYEKIENQIENNQIAKLSPFILLIYREKDIGYEKIVSANKLIKELILKSHNYYSVEYPKLFLARESILNDMKNKMDKTIEDYKEIGKLEFQIDIWRKTHNEELKFINEEIESKLAEINSYLSDTLNIDT